MANNDSAFGLIPVRMIDGGPVVIHEYYLPTGETNDLFIGTPIVSGGSADDDGVADIALAAAEDTLRGVIVGFRPDLDISERYRVGAVERYAYIADHPDTVFQAQEDSDTSTLAKTDVGNNVDLTTEVGNTSTARSTVELDSSSKVSATAQCRLLGKAHIPDNDIGNYCIWEVMINEHELKATAGV